MDFETGALAFGVAASVVTLGAAAIALALRRANVANVLVGSVAHVAVSIPANGVGLIALVVGSRRTTLPARSSDASLIVKNTEVAIIDIRGRIAVVCALH